ncbi:MAG: NAD(P)H-dependent oxidoreductase [Ruminococcaceae bacterium]|jgi:NAD(P)H-dependent FMN reductase|nr:NAD(P)H-dependent oxidoreductase [Oscillospiraceae bacterium]
MNHIAIIIGSTRPGRKAPDVARWVHDLASARKDATFEVVDIADYHLPLLDEAVPPSMHQYAHEHTRRWAEKIASFDGFIFVTPEYNHAPPAALKNALDFIYAEWNNKAAGFVSYGSMGGIRAVEHLRQIAAELQIADVRVAVNLLLAEDFVDYATFSPSAGQDEDLATMLDQLVAWSRALKTVRKERVS